MLGAMTRDGLVAACAVARDVIGVPPGVIDFFAKVATVWWEKDAAGIMRCQCVTIASLAMIKRVCTARSDAPSGDPSQREVELDFAGSAGSEVAWPWGRRCDCGVLEDSFLSWPL